MKDSGNNKEILVLRSPNESLNNAIYLTTLGTNAAGDGDNVKLYVSENGIQREIGSTYISDLYSTSKKIKVKMGINRLEVTLWNADEEMPESATFSVSLKDIAVRRGNIFMQSVHSHNQYGNIEIKYGVSVELPGDLDRSAVLDSCDLASMRKLLIGFEEGIDYFASDVNLDSNVDIRDLIRLKKNASGIK